MPNRQPLRTREPGDSVANYLLASLPADEYDRLRPSLKTVPLRLKDVLHRRGTPLDHVYFPNGGVCSFTTVMTDGSMIEVATVGNEGMVGVGALYDAGPGLGETFVQTGPSTAQQLPVDVLIREVALRGALDQILKRYTVAFMSSLMQCIACNALHTVHQRCCRWLLMTLDRVDGNAFTLSQEFLAIMLGARRPTVSAIAAHLQDTGLIRYRHGRIEVLDRDGLERSSCECYHAIRRAFQDLRRHAPRPDASGSRTMNSLPRPMPSL